MTENISFFALWQMICEYDMGIASSFLSSQRQAGVYRLTLISLREGALRLRRSQT